MFDVRLRQLVDPVLEGLAAAVAKTGLSANAVTIVGAIIGVAAALAIAQGQILAGLALIILNRIMDGIDGALARRNGPTAWGGYLDSLCDFLFYVAVPVGFACAAPANVWPALLLVASFTLTAVSFLALAAIMAGRDMGHGTKAFTYSSGLMEGGETIAFFILTCLLPAQFPMLAMVFTALCLVTVGQRLWLAHRLLR
jgi:phosphatidylglycerophosphate synthase